MCVLSNRETDTSKINEFSFLTGDLLFCFTISSGEGVGEQS